MGDGAFAIIEDNLRGQKSSKMLVPSLFIYRVFHEHLPTKNRINHQLHSDSKWKSKRQEAFHGGAVNE